MSRQELPKNNGGNMEKPVVDVRFFLEIASKDEMVEFLTHLKNLNRPTLTGFINTLENNI